MPQTQSTALDHLRVAANFWELTSLGSLDYVKAGHLIFDFEGSL